MTFKIRPPRRHLFKKLKALVKIGGNVIDTFPIKSARWSSFERKIDLPKDLEGAALPTEVTLVDKKGQRVGQDTGWVWLPGGFWRNLSNWWHRNWFWIPPAPF